MPSGNNGEQVFSSAFLLYLGSGVVLHCVSLSFNSFHRVPAPKRSALARPTMGFRSEHYTPRTGLLDFCLPVTPRCKKVCLSIAASKLGHPTASSNVCRSFPMFAKANSPPCALFASKQTVARIREFPAKRVYLISHRMKIRS